MVLESTPDETANAILDGTFAFMRPVMTSTDGLCVAMTRCIPAALASCESLTIASSTSPWATIIRSASSSTMTTICGILVSFSPSAPAITAFSTLSLYPCILRTLCSAKSWYLLVISMTAQLSAPAAFFGSVTTGIRRCGMPL